ncbi:MAG: hypothetical protein PV340_04070 [Wolbachia sp.]|nr:hypothetical protein [Wolbachia sp.]MDD9336286.1 hypothetical protein [Wolbachia sp.]
MGAATGIALYTACPSLSITSYTVALVCFVVLAYNIYRFIEIQKIEIEMRDVREEPMVGVITDIPARY